jgi:V-type H+-transporting ATPase subunit E
MIKLLEKELLLKCKRDDLQLIRELIPECEQEYVEIMAREVNQIETEEVKVEYNTKLILVETEFLNSEAGGKCGGIVLTSKDKKIVCDNTLESRLNLCFEELLPQIRKTLFPQPEKVKKVEKPKADAHGHKH